MAGAFAMNDDEVIPLSGRPYDASWTLDELDMPTDPESGPMGSLGLPNSLDTFISEGDRRGRPVTAGTGPGRLSPSTMTTMDGTELQVPKSHEFAVIAADENGVTLVNPHGRNKTPDGKTIPGGEFKLDWDEFNYVFRGVSLGGEYPE